MVYSHSANEYDGFTCRLSYENSLPSASLSQPFSIIIMQDLHLQGWFFLIVLISTCTVYVVGGGQLLEYQASW